MIEKSIIQNIWKGEEMKSMSKFLTIVATMAFLLLGSTQLAKSASFSGCPGIPCSQATSCLIFIFPIGNCYEGDEYMYIYQTAACSASTCYSPENYSQP